MRDEAVEAIGNGRARWATGGVVRAEHEVVDEHLRAPAEQLSERLHAVVGVEAVVLVDPDPRQLTAATGELVTAAGVRLLVVEEFESSLQPVLTATDRVRGHSGLLSHRRDEPWHC